jgi:hypothetical protein
MNHAMRQSPLSQQQTLFEILEVLKKMAVSQSQFDAELATLVTNVATLETNLANVATNVTAIGTALTQFITDYNNKSGVDLTNELASVTALVNSTTTDATNAATQASSLSTDAANVAAADPNA